MIAKREISWLEKTKIAVLYEKFPQKCDQIPALSWAFCNDGLHPIANLMAQWQHCRCLERAVTCMLHIVLGDHSTADVK